MMNSKSNFTWRGDWQKRIADRVKQIGYENIMNFCQNMQGKTYSDLVCQLGDDIAVSQFKGEQIREAALSTQLRDAAKDMLVRLLLDYIKHGWKNSIHFNFRKAQAVSDWYVSVEAYSPNSRLQMESVWDALNELDPPKGWKPETTEDEYIEKAFNLGWPKGN